MLAVRGTAVGLEYIAVDDDLTLAQQLHVAGSAQRPADEALDLNRATALLTLGSFTIDALR